LRYHDLENKTLGSLMFVAGDELVHRKVVLMGDQHTAERFDLIREIDTLKGISGVDVSAPIAALEAKLKALTDSIEPGTETWEPIGQTVEDLVTSLLDNRGELGQLLRDAKVRVEASPRRFKFRITEAGMIQMTHQAA